MNKQTRNESNTPTFPINGGHAGELLSTEEITRRLGTLREEIAGSNGGLSDEERGLLADVCLFLGLDADQTADVL